MKEIATFIMLFIECLFKLKYKLYKGYFLNGPKSRINRVKFTYF